MNDEKFIALKALVLLNYECVLKNVHEDKDGSLFFDCKYTYKRITAERKFIIPRNERQGILHIIEVWSLQQHQRLHDMIDKE